MQLHQTGAAILAGGHSSRMGQNKAFLPWRGTTLLQSLAQTLAPFPEKLLSAQQMPPALKAEWSLTPDYYTNCGPLGGLESILTHAHTQCVLLVACDLPFFSRKLAFELSAAFNEKNDCLLCLDETGRINPVCAVYHTRILPQIRVQLDTGDCRLLHLVSLLHAEFFPVHSHQMLNINTHSQWKELTNAF